MRCSRRNLLLSSESNDVFGNRANKLRHIPMMFSSKNSSYVYDNPDSFQTIIKIKEDNSMVKELT